VSPGSLAGYETPGALNLPIAAGDVLTSTGVPGLSFVYHSALVHGYAKDSFGSPVANVYIDASDAGGGGVYNQAHTNDLGFFQIRVRTTTTNLIPEPNTAPGLVMPSPITLAGLIANSETEADFSLVDLYTGQDHSFRDERVQGTLTAAGQALTGIKVTASSSAGQKTVYTDAGGKYEIKVGLGDVTVTADLVTGKTLPGDDPFTFYGLAAQQTGNHDFSYGVNGTIAGVAVDDAGQPLAGVTVSDFVAPDGSTGDTFTITTDSLGRFLLSADTGSILLLGGALAGYTTPDPQAFTINDGTSVTGAILRYQRDGFIRGSLLDSTGDPVYSIVYVNASNGDSHYAYSDQVTGAYVVESPVFPDGRSFTIQALQLDGYVSPATRNVTLTIPRQSLSGVDFTYGNALVVGSVVDGANHPLAGVPIFVEGSSGGKEGFSDANGNYRLPAQVGQATIHPLRFAGFATPDVITVGPLAAGQVANIAPFVYRPLGSVSGIAVDQQGQRLANVIVAVTDGLANYYTTSTDALGRFGLTAAPGTNTVYVRDIFGYTSPAALNNVFVTSGLETSGLLLQFLNPVLSGQLVDSHGNAVQGVTVTASGSFLTQAVTDNNGAFTIKLGLGSSTLTVPDLVGYDTPDPLDVTYLTTGHVGPVTITYGKFTTVIGSQLRVTVFDQDTHAPLDGVTTLF
jgi:hypothetical protein